LVEDGSRDKTPAVKEVGRRHGNLPGKLEFQKFKPPIATPNSGATAQKLHDHARGGVCGEVGVCRQRIGSEDLHPVSSLVRAGTWFGGKSPNKVVCLCNRA
jgi:hypothetical protein